MVREKAASTRLTFGKYKGLYLGEVLVDDPSYIRWLAENCNTPNVRLAANLLLESYTPSKVEQIVKECIMHRGYSEAEAVKFINVIKTK